MWLKKIKHKKMQMFLVGLVLFATTVLCTMCIAFTLELNSFAQKGITEKNCPDLFVFDSGTDGFKQNLRTAEVKDNLENVKSIAGKTISVPILYEGNDISLYDDSLLDASKYSEFGFITKDDPTQNLPNAGEVWLSKTVSEPNHIKIGDTINGDDIKMSYINFSVLDHMDAGVTGVKMSQGTAPGHVGETALGVNLIKLLHVKVGDYIKMEICGVEKQYLVTGSFQSMMSSGYGVMLLEKDVLACDSNYKTSRAYVCLNSKKDIDLFKKDMETRFPGVSVDDNWNAIENSVAFIELMLTSVSSILVGVFIIFSLLNTTIVITMDLKNQRRKYGILKSLGFTTSYMIRQNLCKYSIIIGISIVIATALHKLISARLFGVMVIDAFRDNNLMLTALVAGFALISIMVAWLLSRSIKKITPIELMEE